jgi:hypothetical protein
MRIGKGKAPTYIKMLSRGPRGRIFTKGQISNQFARDLKSLGDKKGHSANGKHRILVMVITGIWKNSFTFMH